ncbi:AtMMH-1 [Auriscalpium vulgare]|uniref:AtMMH-1 n=1 Tax=Auriscalpium vulgare TaxID=40419 RepID=A0ACB8RAZ5_9AGAM|nr:AtMMH-1 [Auriscalpium vulgare]
MPELPEVERAAKLLRSLALNKRIQKVETTEDTIVFSGTTHDDFAAEITGRTVKEVGRYGKVFYLELDGEGKMPVFHFGMTGMLQIRGETPVHYREAGRPRKAATDWPPRFMKCILHIETESDSPIEVAFLDARRLGRVRLCKSPLTEPPISGMGFDPILSLPSVEDFKHGAVKRSCPVKALLLDQSFSAGVGNWVADEILYHARVHPEQRCNTLSDEQIAALHAQTAEVCRTAVEVNADDAKFPEDWLFRHRWDKGKKKPKDYIPLKLPDGEPATIKWLTVGGRTSAYVHELQRLPKTQKMGSEAEGEASVQQDGDASDLTPLTESDTEVIVTTVRKRQRKAKPADTKRSVKRRRSSRNKGGADTDSGS